MNRFYLDTEFVEDGKTIELVSIGLVSFDGETEYYAISVERTANGDEWFQKHVEPRLHAVVPVGQTEAALVPRKQIAVDLLELFGIKHGVATRGTPEIWADFGSYDWIVLCQLYGRMIDLPSGMPMFCMDLQQLLTSTGFRRSELPRQDPATEHNALGDARHLRQQHRYVLGLNWP